MRTTSCPKTAYLLSKSAFPSVIMALLLGLTYCTQAQQGIGSNMQRDFVELSLQIPGILLDVRYYGDDNFVGGPIDGYGASKIYLSRPAARALSQVQAELQEFGMGLKLFDAYRPQSAVDHFVRWARDLDDTRMKQRYYPRVAKEDLFKDGYIAERSGHSRGSTVDLTLIDLESAAELDMGTSWDYFDTRSWPTSNEVKLQQRANRMLLRTVMLKHGFRPLLEEWWHFTLDKEPFPDTYFDFEIK